MRNGPYRKLFFGLLVTFLVLSAGFSIYPSPKVNAQANIWDSCQSISGNERYWSSNRAEASLSIDTSVISPIGTGSIKVYMPATNAWDLYLEQWFNPTASLLKDFTAARPASVYVRGSRTIDWRIEIVTREPSGHAWNTHVVARQTVQANTMTEIQLDFSGISSYALSMAAAVNVIPIVNQQSFTGYVSGLTAYGSVSPPPSPQPDPQTNIWDSCQSLSGAGFVWISSPTAISLSVDTSVKSPLGTGSIMSNLPSGTTSDMYVVERFNPTASLLKDFTAARPASVYVQGSRSVTWRVEVVTREGGGWNSHVVAQQSVPANTMTVISLDYSAISNSALQMAAQVSVVAVVNWQSFTGYVSGLTAYGSVSPPPSPQPTPQPTPQPSGGLYVSGSRILDSTNTPVALRGIGSFEMSWGPWNTGSMTSCVSFLQSQNLNFLRMFVRANLFRTLGQSYIQAIHDLCNIAKSHGVYVEFVFDGLVEGGGQGLGGSQIPYSPYILPGDSWAFPNTAAFNEVVRTLAGELSGHSNALLGIWNEPTYPDYYAYETYMRELANSIQVARNAGFNGIVVLNLWTAFTPGAGMSGLSHGNGDMTFAINNKHLFTNYGSVVADFHAYHCYLNEWGTYPDDYYQLRDLWLYTGRIVEAQNNGICVAYFEGGVRVTSWNVDQQVRAYDNALRICNENGISWSGWCWSSSDPFAALSNMNPPHWNSAGQVLANYAW